MFCPEMCGVLCLVLYIAPSLSWMSLMCPCKICYFAPLTDVLTSCPLDSFSMSLLTLSMSAILLFVPGPSPFKTRRSVVVSVNQNSQGKSGAKPFVWHTSLQSSVRARRINFNQGNRILSRYVGPTHNSNLQFSQIWHGEISSDITQCCKY